jgi:hypothetical protein
MGDRTRFSDGSTRWFMSITSSWIAPQFKHRDPWKPDRDPSQGLSRYSRTKRPSQRGQVIVEIRPHALAKGLLRGGCPPGPGS